MNQFCEIKGIKREFSVARTPQQNRVAERKNRTLIEAVRTMLADSKLLTAFWAKAFMLYDIIFGSTRNEMCTEFEKLMRKKFQMSSMGDLTFFLGLQVTQKDDGIFINQDKSMIGSLMYLTSSRPDIKFAVCACARFQVTPKVLHLHAVKRIFRYLKVETGNPSLSTARQKLVLPGYLQLPGYFGVTTAEVKPSTSASGSQPSGNKKKDKIQQTPSSTQKNKVEAHPRKVKSNLKNKDCVVAPKGTANVQHSKLNANSKLKCVKCNGCMLLNNHDLCVLDFINNVNARVKSKSIKKSSKRKVWKPTGKVFTNIRYIWRPTGRTFTIVGNACPLTRITTTTEVPLRKPIVLDN
ncbi:ribonuclease H-like domain-containing protein [Tanacetum coccineum]